MPTFHLSPRFDASKVSVGRDVLPLALGTQEIRDALAADVRARAFFFARGSNLIVVSRAKELIDLVIAGDLDRATARWQIKEILKEVGYTPEGGFPDELSGSVPPADVGSIRDLSSDKRINFIIDTQVKLMQGRGLQLRGSTPGMLKQFPAWELVRVSYRMAPRNWGGVYSAPPKSAKQFDIRPRWIIAGGKAPVEGRLIALKGDPVWGELGGSGNFSDALDVDYPPFAFNSGMGWRDVTRAECDRLGITGPEGESIDNWQADDHDTLVGTQSGLPAPELSITRTDADLSRDFLKTTGSADVGGTATPIPNRAALEARLKAIEAENIEAAKRSSAKYISSYFAKP